jgi:beta-glucanase (GH16 family)
MGKTEDRNIRSKWFSAPIIAVNPRFLCRELILKTVLAGSFLVALLFSSANAAPPSVGDWELIWSDEFNGASLDTSKWDYGRKPWGTTDNGVCLITSEDTYLENGTLVNRCRMGDFGSYDFSCGWTWSKLWLTYGYLEIRAKYPAGKGQWPAWWMLMSGWPPEFDVAEYRGGSLNYMTQAFYWGQWSTTLLRESNGWDFTVWHTYGFEWGPGYLKWYVDGNVTKIFSGSQVPSDDMYVIFSAGLDSNADATTGFPNYYVIDYFRWYQDNNLPILVDDNEPSITYNGTWGTWTGNPSYMGTEHDSETTGSTATFNFTGTKARYYGFKRNDLGHAEILLDGELVNTVDCYSSSGQYFVMLYESPYVAYGPHTLGVRVKGTKNAQSSGTEIVADAFGYFTTGGEPDDTTPPSPDPMTWAKKPHSSGNAVAMEAFPAYDSSGVQYYFTCTAGGGHNSGWQDSRFYVDTGLSAGVVYTYTVKASDVSVNLNETAESEPASAIPIVPTISISVGNYSFELPGTGKIKGWDNAGNDIPNWSSDTTAADSGVETGYGPTQGIYTGFLMGSDPSVWNLTGHTIAAGEVFGMKVDAKNTSGTSKLRASLYYDDSGGRVTIATKDFTLSGSMQTFTVPFAVKSVPASIGKQIGIELDNVSSGWLGMDNVRLMYTKMRDGDFTGNGMVDMDDLLMLADFWLENDCNETVELNLNGDCIINFYEFSIMSRNWTEE